MAVLNVVDGVFGGLFGGEFEVEVHLGAGGPGQEEIAAGVGSDFVDEFLEGDEVAATLGGLDEFVATFEGDHLGDDDLESVGVDAHGADGGLEAGDVTLVVGAPDVDDGIVGAAEELVVVVGDVGGEVGGGAAGADDDVVAFVAEGGGGEPEGAVAAGEVAFIFEEIEGFAVFAAFV